MHITRRKELTVRMGDYETFKFSAEVGLTHRDLGFMDDIPVTPENLADAFAAAQKMLTEQIDKALNDDINDAIELSTDPKSFLVRAYAPTPLTRSTSRRTR